MKTLLKNGTIVNVFTGLLEQANVLIDGERICGLGSYSDTDADVVRDLRGKFLCPGFIDSHIHIESTMLTPAGFARVAVPHGTTGVVIDPHEIANVCGATGIGFMLEASENIPLDVYVMLPSCVPATAFDESGAQLHARDLESFYHHPRVLGLAEMMNYPGVVAGEQVLLDKIRAAHVRGLTVNGHAPLLSGRELDSYIFAGIGDDHECTSPQEAMERIRKGQRVMIRQGTAARNLHALLPLFDEPWAPRCLLVCDDKHPADLINRGHIDEIIRLAAQNGKNPITGIRMASLWAAEYYGLRGVGAIAPGYFADILVLDDLDTVAVRDVYRHGMRIVADGEMIPFENPPIRYDLSKSILHSFFMPHLTAGDFHIQASGTKRCRVIELVKNELLTNEGIEEIDFDRNNGADPEHDLLKIAVVERHLHTGHIGLGLIRGVGLKSGAIASSISHDSHNVVIIGTNDADMAAAGNYIHSLSGGCVVVQNGKPIAELPLPIAGLMSDEPAHVVAAQNEAIRQAAHALGAPEDVEPFMTTAFASLPVIPHLKLTTLGLVDVDRQRIVPLILD